MDQCRKVRAELIDQWGKRGMPGLEEPPETNELNRHLADCPLCRSFRQNLRTIGENLDDLQIWAEHGTVVPGIAYFENLVNEKTIQRGIQYAKGLKNRLRASEIVAFLGLGILVLTGAGVAVYHGYLLPVGIVFGLTSMQAPLFILLGATDQERGGMVNEA